MTVLPDFLLTVVFAILVKQTNSRLSTEPRRKPSNEKRSGFYHGVASGSPLPTAMIFWTRYTPRLNTMDKAKIQFRIAPVPQGDGVDSMDDQYFADLLKPHGGKMKGAQYGFAIARREGDWVVKLDIKGLKPATTYVYAFTDGYNASPVGKTKTPPRDGDSLDSLKFAVFSCANYNLGYFHAYDIASTIQGLDFWVHLGDYIYEYEDFECNGDRCWEPRRKAVKLDDYRLRYASYHLDEGLQNLRRSAALISAWDDHETANNAAAKGASAHDPKADGSWTDRVKAATQAYLEWMPFRSSMEHLEDGLLPQVFNFGDLMTFVTVDTRIRARSLKPSLLAGAGFPFVQFLPAFDNVDTTAYAEEPLLSEFKNIASTVKETQCEPSHEMIGQEQIDFIATSFKKSSDDGKPWQIFGDQTMMAKAFLPCISDYHEFFPPSLQESVKQVMDLIISDNTSEETFLLRAACAMLITETAATGSDGWSLYGFEREKIVKVLQQNTLNPLVLFGDTHDSWAFQMDINGGSTGEPIAVNIGGPGVVSFNIGKRLEPVLSILNSTLSGLFTFTMQALQDILGDQIEATNDNLVFSNVYNRGFFTVTLTPEESVFEYFGMEEATLSLDFESARAANTDGITANYFCMASLLTTAGQPGSLVKQEDCDTTSFMDERPGYWDVALNPTFYLNSPKI